MAAITSANVAQAIVKLVAADALPALMGMGYLVDSSSHYILGVGVPALVASTIVL